MALAEWQLRKSSSATFIQVNSGTIPTHSGGPLPVGTNSAQLTVSTGIGQVSHDVAGTAGIDYAVNSGLIRTTVFAEEIGSFNHQGLYFMASQADLTGGSGNAYYLNLRASAGQKLQLYKQTFGNGLSDFVGYPFSTDRAGTLGTTGSGFWVNNTVLTLQVRWILDIPTIGGMRITVWTGSALDYSDLVELFDVLDETPHTTTFGEGLFGVRQGGPSISVWENTRLSRY